MHSIVPGSQSDFPHSLVGHPVHEMVDDPNSQIVAFLGGGFAWDFALRNLIPDEVGGITVVIQNSCNQTYTYEVNGKEAFFKGTGDLHEAKYVSLNETVNLWPSTDPKYVSTPGHCLYSMVRTHELIGHDDKCFRKESQTLTMLVFFLSMAT